MNFCLKEKEIRKKEKKKKREKTFPSQLGQIWPKLPPLSRVSALLPRSWPVRPIRRARPRSRLTLLSLVVSPAPPVIRARPFSFASTLSLAGEPRSSAPFPPPVIGHRRVRRRPPPAPSPRH
jgi:hypothetical protein